MPSKYADGGYLLPETVEPENYLCVCIRIPDERYHIAAFWGALQELGYWFNWHRDDAHTALPVSNLWRDIIQSANEKFNQGGVMCFNCDDLKTCVGPLLQQTIRDELRILERGTPYSPGNPPPPEFAKTPLAPASNPGCNRDILWAQCLQIIQYTDSIIRDALELADLATSDLEGMRMLSELPGFDEMGVDAVLSYFRMLQKGITANYAAQYTQSIGQEMACAIFCLCRDDCTITVERIWQAIQQQTADEFGDNWWSAAQKWLDIILFLIDQEIDGDIVVAALFATVWAGGFFANQLLADLGTKSLEMLLALAADDPSSDWEILCTGCGWCHTIDLSQAIPAYITIVEGVQTGSGIEVETTFNEQQQKWFVRFLVTLAFAPNATVTSVRMIYDLTKGSFDESNPFVVNGINAMLDSVLVAENEVQSDTDPDGTDKEIVLAMDNLTDELTFICHASRQSGSSGGGTAVLKSIEICGTGTEPAW